MISKFQLFFSRKEILCLMFKFCVVFFVFLKKDFCFYYFAPILSMLSFVYDIGVIILIKYGKMLMKLMF